MVTGSDDVYCDSRGQSTRYEWIDRVAVGGWFNGSGNNSGYARFPQPGPTFTKGQSTSIGLTPGFAFGAYNEAWVVWIDFDQDGDFSAEEQIFSTVSDGEISGSTVVVPDSALAGATRMRVAMRWRSAAQACQQFSWGEVEDYRVLIVN